MNPVMITAICWLSADAYWLAALRNAKRTKALGQNPWARRVYLAFLLLGFGLCYLPLSSVPVLGWRIIPVDSWVRWVGAAVCAGGVAFAICARHSLASNWSGAVTLKEDHNLVRNGPYRIVRHPIYFGFLVAMAGTALAVGELRAFLPLLNVVGFWKKIEAEEILLRNAFPGEYSDYEKKVRKLLPWII